MRRNEVWPARCAGVDSFWPKVGNAGGCATTRWARTGRTRNLCHGQASYLPPSLPTSLPPSFRLLLAVVVVVVAVALAVVTSPNPICSLAAIVLGSPRLVASLPTWQSAYFDHSFGDGPRQDRTGVTCGIKYFEEGRSTHSALDLYVAHTHALSLFLSLSLWAACVTPRTRRSPSTRRWRRSTRTRTLVCTLALCHGVGR